MGGKAEVAELLLVELELPGRSDELATIEHAALERGGCRHRLEGRADRVEARDGAVDERVERVALDLAQLRGLVLGEDQRVEGRVRRDRENLSCARVESDASGALGQPRQIDLCAQCLLESPLGVEVDRELHVPPGSRRDRVDDPAPDRLTRRVDLDLDAATQELLVLRFDTGDTNSLVALVALVSIGAHVLLGDRTGVAEDVGGRRTLGILTGEGVLQRNPGEALLALGEVELQFLGNVLGQEHRLVRRLLALVEPTPELRRALTQDGSEPLDDLCPLRSDQLPGPGDEVARRLVGDEDLSVPIRDEPALGLDDHCPDSVALGPLGVLLAADHLKEPEPDEQHREQGESDRSQHRDSHRDTPGQGGRLTRLSRTLG
jgi:hypothetical protein